MDLGKNKANMLRDPSSYVARVPARKTFKHQGAPFSRNNTEFDVESNTFPITTPINNVLDKLYLNKQMGENIRKIIKIIQTQYLPQINKLEKLLLNNPTYIYITKILGISKENALRITGVIATLAIIYTANSICRRHKSMVLDAFIYGTPLMSLYEILKKEPELMDEKKRKIRNLMDSKEIVRSEFTKTHELKTWMIYLMICSLFNITDNFFVNRSKPVIEPSITQTVITTTPYLLRDQQVYTTIAQVTPFSERFYNSLSQRIKSTIKYSWYWVLKLGIAYWLGHKDGREIIYNKFAIPLIKKYYEYELKSSHTITEEEISFEDGDSFTKNFNYLPSNHPKPSSNTRDQGLQPPENVGINNNDSLSYYKPKDNNNVVRTNDGYYSDSYYESSEPINLKLSNSGIFSSVKFSNSNTGNHRIVQNTDSLSVEDPWKSNSFIGNNAPIKRNRSFSLNSINHSNNSYNNYRATIQDANNRLSEYYNDIGDNNNTFYSNSLKSKNQDTAL
jgi:hypothetical protein